MSQRRLPQIETIRVIAFVYIFFYHLWSVVPAAGTSNPIGPIFGRFLAEGFAGVLVFNMITGFVLTLPFVGSGAKSLPSFWSFFKSRFARICPQYFIAVLIWSTVAFIVGAIPTPQLLRSTMDHLLFIHVFNPETFFSIVAAWWWLGLLAQFYLFFPFLIRLFHFMGFKAFMSLTLVGCWSLWFILAGLANADADSVWSLLNYMLYFNLPYRLPEFALGMGLAYLWKTRFELRWETLLSLRLHYYFLGAFSCALLIAGLIPTSLPQPFMQISLLAIWLLITLWLFTWPWMEKLGEKKWIVQTAVLSYSFYLVHLPFLEYGSNFLQGRFSPFITFCILGLLAGICTILLSLAIEKLVAARKKPSA